MYKNIKEKITAYGAERRAEFEKLTEGATVGQVRGSWYLREHLTEKTAERLQAMQEGERVPVEIIEKMRAKRAREVEKEMRGYMERVELVEQYEQPERIVVDVEWVKSRTWGKNPHAVARGEKRRTESRASGCGYDKASAAIAGALNQNPEALRILYDHAEAGGTFPYGVTVWAGLPSFDGGCGVSCFYSIFEACGYTFRQIASGKAFDVYEITRAEKCE